MIFVANVQKLKERAVALGITKPILMVCDASFCNRICMRLQSLGVEMLARCRKNAKLCFAYQEVSKRKKYADEKFTPEEVRQNNEIPWKRTEGVYGGKLHSIKYKEINHILWQGGTKTRPLKLIILAPTPYRTRKYGKLYYRQPAYLLCTDVKGDAQELIQAYLSRWQLEVNHREEKSILGVGEAPVTNERSVTRQPAFHVAVYSALLLAARKTYQDQPLVDAHDPKWRKKPKRLSFRTMMGLIRSEIITSPEILLDNDITPVEIVLLLKKAA